MLPKTSRLPVHTLSQLYQDGLYAIIIVIVVLCTTVLAFAGKVPSEVTGGVFTGVVGYVAGVTHAATRSLSTRATDPGPTPHDTP